MLQSDYHYPLVFAKFYDVNTTYAYRKRFSIEGPHNDINICKGPADTFVILARNVKERNPEIEKVKMTDYRTMVLDLVVLEGSDLNGSTKLQFQKLKDAQTLYDSLAEYFNREFLPVGVARNSIL